MFLKRRRRFSVLYHLFCSSENIQTYQKRKMWFEMWSTLQRPTKRLLSFYFFSLSSFFLVSVCTYYSSLCMCVLFMSTQSKDKLVQVHQRLSHRYEKRQMLILIYTLNETFLFLPNLFAVRLKRHNFVVGKTICLFSPGGHIFLSSSDGM